MSINRETAERYKRSDRTTMRWLLASAMLIALIAGCFAVWRTSVAREEWFEEQNQMENYSVEADAVVIAKQCNVKSVKYSWKWNEKDFQGSGWSCNTACSQAKLGDQARIRFLPTNPRNVRCVSDDIETKIGPPSYLSPIFIMIFFVMAFFGPFIRSWKEQAVQE